MLNFLSMDPKMIGKESLPKELKKIIEDSFVKEIERTKILVKE